MFNTIYITEVTQINVQEIVRTFGSTASPWKTNESDLGAPSFPQPKPKTNWVCCLSEY